MHLRLNKLTIENFAGIKEQSFIIPKFMVRTVQVRQQPQLHYNGYFLIKG